MFFFVLLEWPGRAAGVAMMLITLLTFGFEAQRLVKCQEHSQMFSSHQSKDAVACHRRKWRGGRRKRGGRVREENKDVCWRGLCPK